MVEIADTRQKMQTGLSKRSSMTENQGMLFEFGSQKKTPAFWMKDMKFNLDLIWISDGKIIGITPNVPAPVGNVKRQIGNLPKFYPPSAVNEILEVNAGWTRKNNIKIGDALQVLD